MVFMVSYVKRKKLHSQIGVYITAENTDGNSFTNSEKLSHLLLILLAKMLTIKNKLWLNRSEVKNWF